MKIFISVVALLAACLPAFAQTAGQLVPPTFRPPVERESPGFVLPDGLGLVAPPGAEKLIVRLRAVSIDGAESGPQTPDILLAQRQLTERLTRGRISAADIFGAARALEAEYSRAGYVLVRIILPPQKLIDGATLKLTLIDGFVERVDVSNLPEIVRQRIAAVTARLVGRRGLTLAEIERRVLLASDTPGVIMRSTLSPGTSQGATVLVLEAQYRPVVGHLTIDNSLSPELGRWAFGAGLDVNGPLGLGELMYVRASGYPEKNGDQSYFGSKARNRTLAGGVVVPIGVDGWSVNVEGTDVRTRPLASAMLQTSSEFKRVSARSRYPWIRSRAFNLTSELVFDAQEEIQYIEFGNETLPLSQDELRVFRVSTEGSWSAPWGAFMSGRVTPSFGVDGLGARSAADASPLLPLSRQGADAEFQKLEGSVGYTQTVLPHLVFDAKARAQYSFNKPLLRSEQFGIAYSGGLSTLDAGSLQGDYGYVARGELQSPWTVSMEGIGFLAAPYVFGAIGEVNLVQPSTLELASTRATSYGAGVRFGAALTGGRSNAFLTVEYGRAERSDVSTITDRLTFIGTVQF